MITVTQSKNGAVSVQKDGASILTIDDDGTIRLRSAGALDLTSGVVTVGTLRAGSSPGVDASIDIPAVGVITVTKGIVTDFTPA